MRFLFVVFIGFMTTAAIAQTSFIDQLAKHRETYKKDLLATSGGPLQEEGDLAFVQFYAPDSTYRITASVERIPNAQPFDMPTYNGKTRPHVAYALLSFKINGKPQQLTLYRNLNAIRLPQFRDYLFLPFKDATSGTETYGGGRYLDLRVSEIQNGQVTLDFNKAYNPYCAFVEGYPCPIPPKNNVLSIPINAGE
ncbi:MAG: hypothetical protein JWP57_3216, partial [Spirosoma sp.]|nr:hypothetical protein [Spirosoma sp.]